VDAAACVRKELSNTGMPLVWPSHLEMHNATNSGAMVRKVGKKPNGSALQKKKKRRCTDVPMYQRGMQ